MTNQPASGEDPLGRVQNAALRRAITDDTVASRHLAFAGALETARRSAERFEAERSDAAVADALLASVLVHQGVDRSLTAARSTVDGNDASSEGSLARPAPATPRGPTGDARTDPRAVGAALAHLRFDVGIDRAASLAAVSVDEIEHTLAAVGRSGR